MAIKKEKSEKQILAQKVRGIRNKIKLEVQSLKKHGEVLTPMQTAIRASLRGLSNKIILDASDAQSKTKLDAERVLALIKEALPQAKDEDVAAELKLFKKRREDRLAKKAEKEKANSNTSPVSATSTPTTDTPLSRSTVRTSGQATVRR